MCYIGFTSFCKKCLFEPYLFCVKKMASLWTPLHKIILFPNKMLWSLKIEAVLRKNGIVFSVYYSQDR